MARAFPAWEPPLMMLKEGTGRTSFLLPARSARCLYSGTFFSAAPACSQWTSNDLPFPMVQPRMRVLMACKVPRSHQVMILTLYTITISA